MADLSGGGLAPRADGDRGQMLILGAFALAVILVALAVVANSAIYTENLASRGGSFVGGDGPEQFDAEVRHNVGDALEHANRNEATPAAQNAELTQGVRDYEVLAERFWGESGRDVDLSVASTTDGTRIYQSSAASFEDASSNDDWDVTVDDRVRSFEMSVDPPSVVLPFSDRFTVVITDDTGSTWRIRIHENSPGTSTRVEVDLPGGPTLTRTLAGETGAVSVDVTGATVEGEHWDALDAFEPSEAPYDVEFRNGDEAQGTYDVVVADTSSDGDPPNEDPAVYDVTVDVGYQSGGVHYENQLRIAPGELDGE